MREEMPTSDPRAIQRARFETRRRDLTVCAVTSISPHMRRISLTGDLEGFQSLGFDDHVKLFFPDPVTGEVIPPPRDRERGGEGPRPTGRDYTPRWFDVAARVLEIDFVLHEDGPATRWATEAKVGDPLSIGGPRGSMIIPLAFDGYVLIGDETALPAIGRRLEELPPETPAWVVVEVDGPEDELPFDTRANAIVHWVYRPHRLIEEVKHLRLPAADLHYWVACEASDAKDIRQVLIEQHGANPRWVKASGYWRRGVSGAHEKIED